MQEAHIRRILNNPTFQTMAQKKSRLGIIFTIMMLVVYFSFIGYIGISPDTFGIPVSEGATTTWGIYAGLFVIFFTIAITAVYVFKANGEFDRLTRAAIAEAEKEGDI